MLILKFSTIFLMFVGLLCTLAPRLYGTVIILVAASTYGIVTDSSVFQSWVWISLVLLAFFSEVGVRGLRIFLTRHDRVSRRYSIDTSVCNVSGIVVVSALLEPFVGMALWEIIVGKTLLSRLDVILKILLRLVLTAGVRLCCGFLMIVIIINYIIYGI